MQGFTLIELMVTVAIIGVLGSIALMSYSQFISRSEAAVIVHNYEQAVDTARTNYIAARQLQAMGAGVDGVVPPDASGWVSLLNTTDPIAPGGGPAYQVGAGSPVTGAVGVEFNGAYTTRDSTVTINRPAYAGLPASSVIIAQVDF